jgi:hypothetical protein
VPMPQIMCNPFNLRHDVTVKRHRWTLAL